MFTAALIAATLAAPVPKVKPAVEVEPFVNKLLVDDPLELFVTFTNPGPDKVTFANYHVFGVEEDNLVIEVRGPDDREFRAVAACDQANSGRHCGTESSNPKVQERKSVPAGGSRSAVVRLFDTPDRSPQNMLDALDQSPQKMFNQPGKWQVRAVVKLSDQKLRSDPVEIQVARRGAASAKALAASSRLMFRPYHSVSLSDEAVGEWKAAAKDLSGSNAERVIRRMLLLNEVAVVESPTCDRRLADALAAVDKHLEGESAAEQDYLRGRVAEMLWLCSERLPDAMKYGHRYVKALRVRTDDQWWVGQQYAEWEKTNADRLKAIASGKK